MANKDYEPYKIIGEIYERDMFLYSVDDIDRESMKLRKSSLRELKRYLDRFPQGSIQRTKAEYIIEQYDLKLLDSYSNLRNWHARLEGVNPDSLPPMLQPISERPVKFFRPFDAPDFSFQNSPDAKAKYREDRPPPSFYTVRYLYRLEPHGQ